MTSTRGPGILGWLSIRATAIVGFSLMLGTWILVSYTVSARMNDIRQRAAAITERYTNAQAVFATVRAKVLLGSVYVRDALLDPAPVTLTYRRQVEAVYEELNRELQNYVPVLDSVTERDSMERLRREIGDFTQTLLQVLETDSGLWPTTARDLLRTEVVPQREVVIRVSEEMQALNREAFARQQLEIADLYVLNQQRFMLTLSLALAASVGIGVLAVISVGRLEKDLRRGRVRGEQTTRELQSLSSRMVTAQEEERRRIARELHDEVGQGLMAIRVELAVAQNAIETAGIHEPVLANVRAITEGALAKIRDLSHLLHPAMLDDLGLVTAVESYVREFGQRYNIRIQMMRVNLPDRFTREIEASIYRVIQEALTNIAKHSRARNCTVTLQKVGQSLLVVVEDDGEGFEVNERSDAGRHGGLGLISIRERAAQLGGTVRIDSAVGKGTRLSIEVPVRLRDHEPADAAGPRTGQAQLEDHG